MPRSRNTRLPSAKADPDDEDSFEPFAAEPEEEDDAPPPPMLGPKPAPPPESMVALGPPPAEAIAASKWAYQLLMLQAHETMLDPLLSQQERRKQVREILAGAAKHMTDAMRYDAKVAIERQRSELEDRKRNRASAKLEKRTAGAAGAKIIPIRRDG
jgi:hypothetical protein